MRKRIILMITVIVMFLLSGCTRQEYNVVINDNNNVSLTIAAVIDKESYNIISSFGVDISELEENKVTDTGTPVDNVNSLFQEYAMLFQDNGFEITPLDDAVELGFSAKKNYLTIEEFNTEIAKLCENGLSGLNLDIQYVNTKNNKEFKAYGTLNYLLDKDMGLDDEIIKSYFDEQYDTSGMTAKVYITMPDTTQVTNYDGKVGQNGAIYWETSYKDGETPVHIISSYKDNTIIYAIVLAIVVLLLVVGFFILRARKFKKEKENSALADEYQQERENNS